MTVISKSFTCNAIQFAGRPSWPDFVVLFDRFAPVLSEDGETLILSTPGQTLRLGVSSWLLFDDKSAWTESDADFKRLYEPVKTAPKTKKAK